MAQADRIRITKKNRAPDEPLSLTISSLMPAIFVEMSVPFALYSLQQIRPAVTRHRIRNITGSTVRKMCACNTAHPLIPECGKKALSSQSYEHAHRNRGMG